MVIDFRIRPPFKSFLTLGLYTEPVDPEYPSFTYGRDLTPSMTGGGMDSFMREFEESGTTLAVIMGRSTGNEKLGKGNVPPEEIYELMERYPGKFAGFVGVDPLDPGAPAQIRRSVGKLGMKGVALEPGWCNPPCYADDPRFAPVYETIATLGVPVVLTMSVMAGPDLTYTDPVRVERMAAKYPEIPFVVAHAAWPYFIQLMAVALRHKNVYLVPDCYFYMPCMPMIADVMPMFNSVLQRQVIYASTYPVRGLKQALDEWKARPWEAEALERSLYGNAARLLKLEG
ncbi:amidohydrolase family protein [Desulfovibrio sp. OttesenSCG-928-C14]|nr:amidohydrolase family protein [Desulfovibrio sp. OttesenSCG-928-C14]